MAFKVKLNEELGIVEIIYSGDVYYADVKAAIGAAFELGEKKGFNNYYSELTDANLMLSSTQLYLVDFEMDLKSRSKNVRSAILCLSEGLIQRFYLNFNFI